ncbi:pi-plc x domain-containing protein at5g67130 [Phtheirospermum japonicum]|uniref:Pi-plc x domain-containing protein at5g67130 n=1 Tax=Phtheirospermum japonicum TaxID=374723 RepID=A0A830B5F2_9LAMI|nr:pi-plc x domain-containing protein at5g67130 [Phtheirospermum japonicum]
MGVGKILFSAITALLLSKLGGACSNGACKQLGDGCSTDSDCGGGLFCNSCEVDFEGKRCVRSTATNQFNLMNNSLPFNKYAFLTTHNAFAIDDSHPRLTFTNQEDSVTQQLNNGVRALMLDTYDFEGDIWLCHSFGGKCHDYTKFELAVDTLKEIETFLSGNPSEIVTLILEDYVHTPRGLTKVFEDAGLTKYWFPVSKMPKNGEDWPLVSDMVANNQRLLVFTSMRSKENSEGIAYQWNYMVENQYGDDGMEAGKCLNRSESSALTDTTKSLVLVNYFRSIPLKPMACVQNSADLTDMLTTCYGAAGNRWPNFVAVDFYKKSEGGGTFKATDMLNGELLCGCNDVHSCIVSL